jgi:phosphoglycolate phosphatase
MRAFPFTTIGFDLDGTLLDTAADLGAAVNHALALVDRAPVPAEAVAGLIGGGARLMLRRALALTGGELDDAERDRLFGELLRFYDANIAVHTRPYPGTVDALRALAAANVRLGVATNKRESFARKVLDATGLLDRFACVLGGDTLGEDRKKPSPDLLIELRERCGGGPAAFVGDSSFDVRAAKAAGMPCVVVSFGFNDGPAHQLGADAVIDSFAELVPALQALRPATLGQGRA